MLAEDLKALNDSRKEMTERGIKEAAEMIETTSLKEDKVFVIYLPDCHESIAGIIAGKIRDRYYRPTIILTKAEDGVKDRDGLRKSMTCLQNCVNVRRCLQNSAATGRRQACP